MERYIQRSEWVLHKCTKVEKHEKKFHEFLYILERSIQERKYTYHFSLNLFVRPCLKKFTDMPAAVDYIGYLISEGLLSIGPSWKMAVEICQNLNNRAIA